MLGIFTYFVVTHEPSYAILPLGVGIMINGQVMVNRSKSEDE